MTTRDEIFYYKTTRNFLKIKIKTKSDFKCQDIYLLYFSDHSSNYLALFGGTTN